MRHFIHTADCEMSRIDASFNCTCGAEPQAIPLTDPERHELECLRHRVQQLAYPCSPHCDGYLREQALSNTEVPRLNAQIATLRAALDRFVQGYSHTEVFLRSRERMHPDGLRLYRDDVERARAALEQGNG